MGQRATANGWDMALCQCCSFRGVLSDQVHPEWTDHGMGALGHVSPGAS